MDPEDNQFLQHEASDQRLREREAAMRRVAEGEEPWREDTGALSVVDAVRDLRFPATIEQILEKAGDRDVRTSEDVELPLAYLLPKLDRRDFASLREFEASVLEHWRGIETLEQPLSEREPSQTLPPGVDVE